MNSLDPSDMHSMIANYPLQFAKGLAWASQIHLQPPINRVILTGMGGSALSGDLINVAFPGILCQPILISRDYHIPYPLDRETLVIVNSFSGNTEETLSAYQQALQSGAQVVAIASGGKLLDQATADNVQSIRVVKEPENFQPRMSSGYIFAILTELLIKAGHLPETVRAELLSLPAKLTVLDSQTIGQQLGESLSGSIPIIYTSDQYWPIARIAKIKINENSKIPAFWNYLPEMNHNELVGFSNTQDRYHLVLIQDPDDNTQINRRMQVVTQVLSEYNIPSTCITMLGTDRLTKIFSSLMIADWTSYYLALKLGIDPTPVKLVEDFKVLLR